MRYDILIVEDESSLLRGLVRGLQIDPDLNPTGVATVDEALRVIENVPPDLLVTDIRLPGRSGLDLIRELEDRGLHLPVVVMTAHRSAYQHQIDHRSGLLVLEKPVPIAKLRNIVRSKLREIQAGSTPTGPFQVVDYLQLASLGRHTLRFEVQLVGGATGKIEVVEGELWNAHWTDPGGGTDSGEEALQKLLDAEVLRLGSHPMTQVPDDRQMEGSTESLLLELARQADERNRDQAFSAMPEPDAPADEAVSQPTPTGPAPDPPASDPLRTLCREIRADVDASSDRSTACAVVETSSGRLRGASSAEAASLTADPLLASALHAFNTEDSEVEATREAFLATETTHRFLHRTPQTGWVGVLVTPVGVKAGLAWNALRRLDDFEGLGEAVTRAENGDDSPAHRLAPMGSEVEFAAREKADADESVDSDGRWTAFCRRLALQVENCHGGVVVDVARTRRLGASSDALPEEDESLLQRLLPLFAPGGTLGEGFLANAERRAYALRFEADLVAAVVTGRRVRPGIVSLALRDALAGLSQ